MGENAALELERHAPYENFVDMLVRVNRRRVNKTVLLALAKAGALREILPIPTGSAIRLLESGELLKRAKRKKPVEAVRELLDAHANDEPWDPEDLWAAQLSVGVAGTGEHPMGVLASIDEKHLRSDWKPLLDAEDGCLVRGIVTSYKVGTSQGRRASQR